MCCTEASSSFIIMLLYIEMVVPLKWIIEGVRAKIRNSIFLKLFRKQKTQF